MQSSMGVAEQRRMALLGVPQWRARTGRLVSACSACHSRAMRNIDDFVLMGFELPRPFPTPVLRQVRVMRFVVLFAGLLGFAAMTLQYSCVTRSWTLLDSGVPASCGWLHLWLLAYAWVLTVFPFCAAFAGPPALLWAFVGLAMRSHLGERRAECKQQSPELYGFVDEFMTDNCKSCMYMGICLLLLWFVRCRVKRLQNIWGTSGPAGEEVVRRILAEALPREVDPETECSICLQSGADDATAESGEAPRWRSLRCGHAFHEQCLVEWLRHARRCPLCRDDLHAAYLRSVAAETGMVEVS